MTETDPRRRFTAMYDAHYAQVYAYAVSRAGRQLADDIVSDTFLVAWRRLGAAPQVPLPWLLGVARNVVRERYREEVRQVSLAAELRAWIDEADADVADGVVDRAVTLAALARLDEDDRELLTLVAWHGLSAGDAALDPGADAHRVDRPCSWSRRRHAPGPVAGPRAGGCSPVRCRQRR